MTIMIPNTCADTCPIAQVLYKNLNEQLDGDDKVVQYLYPDADFLGSLFWVQHKRRSLFIYLAHSTESDISLGGLEFEDKSKQLDKLLENKEVSQLLLLQQQLLPKKMDKYRSQLAPFVIINPYADEKYKHMALKSFGLFFFGKELIKSNKLGVLIYKLLGIPSSELLLQHMRYVFNPELIFHNDNVNKSQSKHLAIKESLLDAKQEFAMKAHIVLQNKDYDSDNYNLTGVSGYASSGKTEVLIQRAKLIAQLDPASKTLIITANAVSQALLRKRCDVAHDDKSIEVFSFNEWCKQQLKPSKHLIDDAELNGLIEVQLKKHLEVNNISKFAFLRELDFIYGREIFYEKDYLSTQDLARPYALSSDQFIHIWRAVLTLKNELSLRNWLLPARIPQLFLDALQEKPEKISYDHVLVDDADLLSPIAFELFKKVIKPESGQLFVTLGTYPQSADLKRLWKDVRLDIHRHNVELVHHYQIDPAILNASKAFSLSRMSDGSNSIDAEKEIEGLEEALFPRLLHFLSEVDEQNRLLNEIKELVHNDCNPQEILIICNDDEINQLTKLMTETLNLPVDHLNDFHHISRQKRKGLGICNYLQAQGLKSSYVFVFGLKQLFDEEEIIKDVGVEQHQAKQVENTYLIANAMTRAIKELTLFVVAEKIPSAFVDNPFVKIPTSAGDGGDTSVIRYLRKSG